MASSRKKVVLRATDKSVRPGYLPLTGIVEERGGKAVVDLLDLEGRIVPIPLESVQSIAYVRDFNLADKIDPERLSRKTFLARPRGEGLWIRLTLAGTSEVLEGLAPLDLSLIDGLLEDRGIYLIPPDIRSNTQRLYLPRTAIMAVQLLAVITTPSKVKPVHPDSIQESLFPSSSRDR
jgi:hypothetical protein